MVTGADGSMVALCTPCLDGYRLALQAVGERAELEECFCETCSPPRSGAAGRPRVRSAT